MVILNTSKKFKNLHNNNFELKVHLESKLILIQWLDEEDWIKSMYIEYIIYNFLAAIGLMFMIHETSPNKGKLKIQCNAYP